MREAFVVSTVTVTVLYRLSVVYSRMCMGSCDGEGSDGSAHVLEPELEITKEDVQRADYWCYRWSSGNVYLSDCVAARSQRPLVVTSPTDLRITLAASARWPPGGAPSGPS